MRVFAQPSFIPLAVPARLPSSAARLADVTVSVPLAVPFADESNPLAITAPLRSWNPETVGPAAGSVPALSGNPLQNESPKGFPVNWGRPAHHVFIAGATTVITSSVWWSLFLYGGKEGASAFAVLISAMVPTLVVGGFFDSFLHDILHARLLEGFLKPRMGKLAEKLGLGDLLGSLKGNQSLPDFQYNLLLYRANVLEFELTLHLLERARSKLEASFAGRAPIPAEEAKVAEFSAKIAEGEVALAREQERMRQAGMADDGEEAAFRFNAGYLTFLASAAATVGGMIYAFGAPQWTQNTRDLMTYFGVEAFFGTIAGYVYYRVIHENVMGYVVHPLENRINRALGRDVFPAATGELGIPEPERLRKYFDRGERILGDLGLLLGLELDALEGKPELSEKEKALAETWRECLGRQKDLVQAIHAALKEL